MRKPSLYTLFRRLVAATCIAGISVTATADRPGFEDSGGPEYRFDTGVVTGTLKAQSQGESVGVADITYNATGQPISRVYGWINHYRVYTQGQRYGRGMRHLPSDSQVFADGSAQSTWPASAERPFTMRALYHWREPHILEVETIVQATAPLEDFELFLAAYFPATFTEVRIPVHAPDAPSGVRWVEAAEAQGDRQAFPRDAEALRLLQDGRWNLEPNPIDWTVQPERAWPMSLRRDPDSGVTVVLMSDPTETFVTYSPHATQRHYALYYSVFGRSLAPGEVATSRMRAVVLNNPDEAQLLEAARAFFGQLPPGECACRQR